MLIKGNDALKIDKRRKIYTDPMYIAYSISCEISQEIKYVFNLYQYHLVEYITNTVNAQEIYRESD